MRRSVAYAVERCPGWSHPDGCLAMDALGQPRCNHCGWSWGAHRTYGRPHPPSPPPDYDDATVARAFAGGEDGT
jgi:hypothetical protein